MSLIWLTKSAIHLALTTPKTLVCLAAAFAHSSVLGVVSVKWNQIEYVGTARDL